MVGMRNQPLRETVGGFFFAGLDRNRYNIGNIYSETSGSERKEDRMDSLFETPQDGRSRFAPLADRMRPADLSEIYGQEAAVGKGTFLYQMIERDTLPSLLLFGPPGCGKTTIASVVAQMTKSRFIKLNATAGGIKDVRDVVAQAKEERNYYGRRTIVFIDEIHRFNKGQQDVLLPYVEDGTFVLIGATTENPYFEINGPLLSRLRLIRLAPLDDTALVRILRRALADREKGLGQYGYRASDAVLKEIAGFAGGDARMALNLLEQAAAMAPMGGELTEEALRRVAGDRLSLYDKNGDYHYDIVSAFIKSMRGSDPDAALHYMARMIAGGEKPSFISRRIMICAAEDVGLADPQALQVAVAAAQAAEMVGFPEGRIPLAEAVVYICLAPKSNSAINGIDAASADVRRRNRWSIPAYLKDAHYSGAAKLGQGIGYKYPHNYGGWVEQQYLPDELKDAVYYTPVENGKETELSRQWKKRRGRTEGGPQ